MRDDEAGGSRHRHGARPEGEEVDVERVAGPREERRGLVHAAAERSDVALGVSEELGELEPWQLDIGQRQVGEAARDHQRGRGGEAGRDGNGAVHAKASPWKGVLPTERVPEGDRRGLVVVGPVASRKGRDITPERVVTRLERGIDVAQLDGVVGALPGSHQYVTVDGDWENGQPVVVGMLADQVDAGRCPGDDGGAVARGGDDERVQSGVGHGSSPLWQDAEERIAVAYGERGASRSSAPCYVRKST